MISDILILVSVVWRGQLGCTRSCPDICLRLSRYFNTLDIHTCLVSNNRLLEDDNLATGELNRAL